MIFTPEISHHFFKNAQANLRNSYGSPVRPMRGTLSWNVVEDVQFNYKAGGEIKTVTLL